MPWAGWTSQWAVYAVAGTLIASSGPAYLGVGARPLAVTARAAAPHAGMPHGRRPAKHSKSAVSIAARIAHATGGRKPLRQKTCPATVTLAVTVAYRPPAHWARHDTLLYQAPHGIHVLKRPTPPVRHAKSSHGHKNKATPKRVAHPDTISTRLVLPRPKHGRVTVTLHLSVPTVSVQIHPKRRPKRRALMVRIGGTVRVLRGRATLAKSTLHLQAPIACASAASARQRSRPSATPTARGATPPGSATALAGASVTIQNFAFSPTPITVTAGSTVTWVNRDGVAHTVSADDGSWGSGNLAQGATYSHTFDKPGTYTYHCAIHPYMHGTVVVTPAQPTGSISAPTATPTATPSATEAPAAASVPPSGATARVAIVDDPSAGYAFSPASIVVSPGTTVLWTSQSGAPHTVTADDGSWGSDVAHPLNRGDTYSYTFNSPGNYTYHCAIHPFMHGQVIVVAPGAPTPTATATNTPTATPTASATPSASPTPQPTDTPLPPGVPTNTPTATSTPTSTPVVAGVAIVDDPSVAYAFSPAAITVAAGTTVIWTNQSSAPHTVTADDGSWGSGTLAPGATFSHTFNSLGTYTYHCAIHPFMHGTVIVGIPPPTATSSATATPTTTAADTATPTPTASATATRTATAVAPTSTGTVSASATPPATATATATRTATATAMATATNTPVAAAVAIVNVPATPLYAFSPMTITVAAGTTVVWTNDSSAPHTVTADDGSWSSNVLNHGGTYSRTFTAPGTYTYHCSIHPYMLGAVVVEGTLAPRRGPARPLKQYVPGSFTRA